MTESRGRVARAFFLLLTGAVAVFALGILPLYAQGLEVSAGWVGVGLHLPMLAAMGAIAWAVLVRYLGRSAAEECFALPDAGSVGWFGAGAVAGVTMPVATAFALAGPLAAAARPTAIGVLVPAFLAFGLSAGVQLLALRGLGSTLRVRSGDVVGAGVASAVFTAFHLDPKVPVAGLATTFVFGLLALAVIRARRSFAAAVGLHGGWNWTLAALLGGPLSGEPTPWGVFAWPEPGPGGAYGLEGSWATVAVLAVALVGVSGRPSGAGRSREAP